MEGLYSKIFSMASENMQRNGMELGLSYETFQLNIAKNPEIIDASEFNMKNPRELYTAVILRCENRIPGNTDWVEFEKLSKREHGNLLSIKYVLLLRSRKAQRFLLYNRKMTGLKELRNELLAHTGIWTLCRITCEELLGECKRLLYKYLLMPVWENLSLEKKNKIRAVFRREAKSW